MSSSTNIPSTKQSWRSTQNGLFKFVPTVTPRHSDKGWTYECNYAGQRSLLGTMRRTRFDDVFDNVTIGVEDLENRYNFPQSDYQKGSFQMDAQRMWEGEIRGLIDTLKVDYPEYDFVAERMCTDDAVCSKDDGSK